MLFQIKFCDVGCGYGGLLVTLSPMFPETFMVGFEIRVKVSDYVNDRYVGGNLFFPITHLPYWIR